MAATSMARATLTSIVGNAAGPLSMMVIAPLLAHSLGADARGRVAAATVPITLASAALTLGIPEALTYLIGRRYIDFREGLRTGLVVLVIVGAASGLLVWFASPVLGGGDRQVSRLIRITAVAFMPSIALWGFRGAFQGIQDFRALNREKWLAAMTRIVGVVLLAIVGKLTVTSAALVVALSPLAGLASYGSALIGPARARFGVRMSIAPRLLRFGSGVWLGSVAGILLARLDQLLMVQFTSDRELGLYAVAVNVGEVSLFAVAAVGSVVLVKDAAAPSNDRLAATSSALFVGVGVLVLPLLLSSPFWTRIVFGADFATAWLPASILLTAAVLGCPGSIAGSALTGRGRPVLRSVAVIVGLALNVVSLIFLVPRFGATGAALATLVGSGMASAICVYWCSQVTGIAFSRFLLPDSQTRGLVSQRLAFKSK